MYVYIYIYIYIYIIYIYIHLYVHIYVYKERKRLSGYNHIKLMFSSYVLSLVISSISVTYRIGYS